MSGERTMPRRQDLVGAELVHSQGPRKPRIYSVEVAGSRYAVKDAAGLSAWRRALWRWWLRREARVYRALQGIEGVPVCYGLMDSEALVMGFLSGDVVRRESVPNQRSDFFKSLERLVREMHARGYIHLDLGHRRNVLVLDDGTPAIVDLAGALRLARVPLIGWLGRWIDLHCVRKLERRYGRRFFASREGAA